MFAVFVVVVVAGVVAETMKKTGEGLEGASGLRLLRAWVLQVRWLSRSGSSSFRLKGAKKEVCKL